MKLTLSQPANQLDLFVGQALARITRLPTEHEVDESYSGDKIPEGKVRKPFQYRGRPHIYTDGCHGRGKSSYSIAELIPATEFKGKPTSYDEKVVPDGGEKARGDKNGFYYGMRVKNGQAYVIGRAAGELVFVDGKLTKEIPWEETDKFQSRFAK